MFSGSWKESSESEIGIDVPDDNIDIKGKDRSLATLPVCSVGHGKESSESEIGIEVPDDNIDIKGKDRSLATLPVCSVGHGRNHLKVRLALMYQMTTLISKVRIEV